MTGIKSGPQSLPLTLVGVWKQPGNSPRWWRCFGSCSALAWARGNCFICLLCPSSGLPCGKGFGASGGNGLVSPDFGIVVTIHLFPPGPGLLAQIGLLMLVVSAVGLIVGSAVAERHRIALELQDQTVYLNSLIENSPFGIAVLDRQGRVEFTNAAFEKLVLYEQNELTGGDLDSILATRDEPEVSSLVTPQVLAGQALHATVRRRRKDGKVLDVEVDAVPLLANGRVRGAYTIYKDVSDEDQGRGSGAKARGIPEAAGERVATPH